MRLYGKPYSCRVDWTVLTEYRANCLETSKNDMDLIIKVQLFHYRNNSMLQKNTKQRKEINQDNNIILMVSKFVGKPLLLHMQLAGKQLTLLHNH